MRIPSISQVILGSLAGISIHPVASYAITGGSELAGDFAGPSIVVRIQKAESMKDSMVCSATILHSTLLVTNGHCVEDYDTSQKIKVIDPQTGESYTTVGFPHLGPKYRVGFADYSLMEDGGKDIAIVRLRTAIRFPHRVATLPDASVLRDLRFPLAGTLIANGVGRENSWGGKNLSLAITLAPYLYNNKPMSPPVLEYQSGVEGRGPCDQDSGGGIFAQIPGSDAHVLIAITSTKRMGVACGSIYDAGYAVPLATHIDWIRATLAKQTGS